MFFFVFFCLVLHCGQPGFEGFPRAIGTRYGGFARGFQLLVGTCRCGFFVVARLGCVSTSFSCYTKKCCLVCCPCTFCWNLQCSWTCVLGPVLLVLFALDFLSFRPAGLWQVFFCVWHLPVASYTHTLSPPLPPQKVFNVVYGRNVLSLQKMEVSLFNSLLRVGTVLRLERDAWSTVKWLRQVTNEHSPPIPSSIDHPQQIGSPVGPVPHTHTPTSTPHPRRPFPSRTAP